jgi:hypothetical protein
LYNIFLQQEAVQTIPWPAMPPDMNHIEHVWPSVVVHEHWPVSQRMIVEMGDYAWSEQTTLGHIEPELYNIFLQQEAVQTISWPAMSPDMNPIEHVWDFIGRKINQRNPKC